MTRSRTSLRTRLVVAMLLVASSVLALSFVATYGLVRRSLQQHALTNLRTRALALPGILGDLGVGTPGETRRERLAQLATGLKLTDMAAIQVMPNGDVIDINGATRFSLPAPLSASDVLPNALYAGEEVSGRRGNTVFVAIPLGLILNGRRRVAVVATDTVDTSVLRRTFPLWVLAGLVVLGLAAALATWLARRLTRPIRDIEHAAQQLASGDLSARAEVPPSTDDELAALAATLNAMAAQLEQSRGSERAFLLSISHDLRTPLTSIRGYAEALADGTLDDAEPDERKRAATVIGAEARRLERLVRDLLDLSRLDSHQFSLSPRPGDAAEIVRDAAEAFAPQARELGIRLAVTPAGALPVDLDPERVGQIVANLVENAMKYAQSKVEVYAAAHGPDHVAIVVTDDGPGIPADKVGLVFDRLYTVRDTPGRAVGTGLGLAIVRELASAMGGRAWAEAPADGGSRFVVSLPTRVHATVR